MKTLKKRLTQCLLPILAGVVMGMGCGQDVASLDDSKEAIILDFGDPSVDGCGWVIKTIQNNEVLKPLDLANDFLIDSLQIKIEFTRRDEFYSCGFNSVSYELISITKLEKI